MKVCIVGDVHFCQTSSIITTQGKKYTKRLENLINSLNWVESEAEKHNCDAIYYLGDFFNRPTLTDQELTALSEIKWSSLPHTFLVGNHESSIKSLCYSSVYAIKQAQFRLIDKPTLDMGFGYEILLLPYITEDCRKPLSEYWNDVLQPNMFTTQEVRERFIFSHNDVKGVQYGAIVSNAGFDVKDIETNCRLFVNGHIHNGTRFCRNGMNIGNLTGQNFTEDAFQYDHSILILDTYSCEVEKIENPFAFNFYKFTIEKPEELEVLNYLKTNSAVSVSCKESLVENLNKKLTEMIDSDKIVAKRVLVIPESTDSQSVSKEVFTMDHLNEFATFCRQQIGTSTLIENEISEVCK